MIVYHFIFDDGARFRFEVDEEGDTSVEPEGETFPEWVLLDQGKCAGCNLPEGSRKTCPAALSIQPVIEAFGKRISHEHVKVIVVIGGVKVEGEMSAQGAVRSLMGLRLALSSCPVLGMLRPMARFHVPFATQAHALFRFVGMTLMAQHFRREAGLPASSDLSRLLELIGRLHEVNHKLAGRIKCAAEKDAAINSLVNLDTLAALLEVEIDADLDLLKSCFKSYLDGAGEEVVS